MDKKDLAQEKKEKEKKEKEKKEIEKKEKEKKEKRKKEKEKKEKRKKEKEKKEKEEKKTVPSHVDTQPIRVRKRRGNVIRTGIDEHTVFLFGASTQCIGQLVYLYRPYVE